MHWRIPMQCAFALVLLSAMLYGPAATVAAGRTIHLVFGSHLDIGFNNIEPEIGWDNNVINKYFNEYLPRAVDIADAMASQLPSQQDRYIYTTSSWLISLFLDCPTHIGLTCPDATTREKVLRGIKSRAITWHAHPHKAQYEFYDSSFLAWATDFTHDLDRRFGFKPKNTVLLRDVPGMTRAAIPILAAKGVKAISVGVNQASAPPGVPFYTPFIWRDEASDTQLLAFWHPGGYGGYHRDLILDPPEQCIQAAGLNHVLCTSWRWDNSGPAVEVLDPMKMFEVLREDWGGQSNRTACNDAPAGAGCSGEDGALDTSVIASTFDAFVDAVLEALPSLNLPVVTAEIGDTWIWGVQSDPLKVANFRAAARARAACMTDPACPSNTPQFDEFSRLLLKVPEHTWGVDVKKTLHDFVNYSNPDFYACLPQQLRPKNPGAASASLPASNPVQDQQQIPVPGTRLDGRDAAPCPNYEDTIASWERQAAWVDWAVQALPPDHPVAIHYKQDLAARQRLASITALDIPSARPSLSPPGTTESQAGVPHGHSYWFPRVVAAKESLRGEHDPADLETPLTANTGRVSAAVSIKDVPMAVRPKQQQLAGSAHQQNDPDGTPLSQDSSSTTKTDDSSGSSNTHGSSAAATSAVESVQHYTCGGWKLAIDLEQGGVTSLAKMYGDQLGTDWAKGAAADSSSSSSSGREAPPAGSISDEPFSNPSLWNSCDDSSSPSSSPSSSEGVLGQLLYHVYSETSYDFIWNHYGWEQPAPWWFPLDFGKVNSSRAWPKEMQATAKLEQVYAVPSEPTWASISATGRPASSSAVQHLALRYTFPEQLVKHVGAPPVMWSVISCPASHDGPLDVSVVWQDKPPTRLPEAIWFSFKPALSAVDTNTWRLHKLDSTISPLEVLVNGSQSMHAVSDQGISVSNADGSERLQVMTFDASLVSPGRPTAFPNGQFPPCMSEGMHFNLENNVWGTNYVMWVPYSARDVNMAFRFRIDARSPASNIQD